MNKAEFRRQAQKQDKSQASNFRQPDEGRSGGRVASGPVSLAEATGRVSLQFGVQVAAHAICHVASSFGHGVCRWSEVLGVVLDAFSGTPDTWPDTRCAYRPDMAVVDQGLLSPAEGEESGYECAVTALGYTPGVVAVAIVVPRRAYDTLVRQIEPPQRVRPAIRDGAVVFCGINPYYNPFSSRGLGLEDILAR